MDVTTLAMAKKYTDGKIESVVGGLPTVEVSKLDNMMLGMTDEDTEREKAILLTAIKTGKAFILKARYNTVGTEKFEITSECVASVYKINHDMGYACLISILNSELSISNVQILTDGETLQFNGIA